MVATFDSHQLSNSYRPKFRSLDKTKKLASDCQQCRPTGTLDLSTGVTLFRRPEQNSNDKHFGLLQENVLWPFESTVPDNQLMVGAVHGVEHASGFTLLTYFLDRYTRPKTPPWYWSKTGQNSRTTSTTGGKTAASTNWSSKAPPWWTKVGANIDWNDCLKH